MHAICMVKWEANKKGTQQLSRRGELWRMKMWQWQCQEAMRRLRPLQCMA